jgi:hypothetical protein
MAMPAPRMASLPRAATWPVPSLTRSVRGASWGAGGGGGGGGCERATQPPDHVRVGAPWPDVRDTARKRSEGTTERAGKGARARWSGPVSCVPQASHLARGGRDVAGRGLHVLWGWGGGRGGRRAVLRRQGARLAALRAAAPAAAAGRPSSHAAASSPPASAPARARSARLVGRARGAGRRVCGRARGVAGGLDGGVGVVAARVHGLRGRGGAGVVLRGFRRRLFERCGRALAGGGGAGASGPSKGRPGRGGPRAAAPLRRPRPSGPHGSAGRAPRAPEVQSNPMCNRTRIKEEKPRAHRGRSGSAPCWRCP